MMSSPSPVNGLVYVSGSQTLGLANNYQGVVTPICAVLRAATGVTICDRPKTACDRVTALLNCR